MPGIVDPSAEVLRSSTAEMRHPAEVDRELAGFDLHEGICQELVGAAALTTALARRLERKDPEEAARAHQIAALITRAAAKTRSVACALASNTAAAKGLHGALLQLRDSAAAALPCRLEYPARVELPLAASMHLYRIAHQAVLNAVAHSTATELVISLCALEENIILSVEDNGCGFDASKRTARSGGIFEMRQSAMVLGAALTIETMPGCGTRVSCITGLQED